MTRWIAEAVYSPLGLDLRIISPDLWILLRTISQYNLNTTLSSHMNTSKSRGLKVHTISYDEGLSYSPTMVV
jgi:hypothetical protein